MQNIIIMSQVELNHPQEEDYHQIARETGKFKPIIDQHETKHHQYQDTKWNILPPIQLDINTELIKTLSKSQTLWRFYLQKPISMYKREEIHNIILNSFELLAKKQLIHEQGQMFLNIHHCLIERLQLKDSPFHISMLDYQCIVVLCSSKSQLSKTIDLEYFLSNFYISPGQPYQALKSKNSQFPVKQIYRYKKIILLLENQQIKFKVQKENEQNIILEINHHQLEHTIVNWNNSSIIFKNISIQNIQYNISEEAVFDPLQATFQDHLVFQEVLRRINRMKYLAEKNKHQQRKQWHSFDNKLYIQNQKQAKTTPEKLKNINYKHYEPHRNISNNSTNVFNHSETCRNKINKINMFAQSNKLKISQRVITGPKQSNLTPSEMDYAVSVKDQNEKESGYFDEFQNILYEQEGISEQKQLALNSSFQQFEKKEQCPKEKQILQELNKRRKKEQEEKRLLDQLKNKLKDLMNQQKQWINKNFKLKIDIKKLKKAQSMTEDNKQIIQIKSKIAQLISSQDKLMLDLNRMKKSDSAKFITYTKEQQEKNISNNKAMIHCSVKNENFANFSQFGSFQQSNSTIPSYNTNKTYKNKELLKNNAENPKKSFKFVPSPINMAQIKIQNKGNTNDINQEDSAKANISKLSNNLFMSTPINQGAKQKFNTITSQQLKIKQKTSFVINNDNPPRFIQNSRQANINQDNTSRIISRSPYYNSNPNGNNEKYIHQNIQPSSPCTPTHNNNYRTNNIISNYQNNYHQSNIVIQNHNQMNNPNNIQNFVNHQNSIHNNNKNIQSQVYVQNQINMQNKFSTFNHNIKNKNSENNIANNNNNNQQLIIPNIVFTAADQSGYHQQQSMKNKTKN